MAGRDRGGRHATAEHAGTPGKRITTLDNLDRSPPEHLSAVNLPNRWSAAQERPFTDSVCGLIPVQLILSLNPAGAQLQEPEQTEREPQHSQRHLPRERRSEYRFSGARAARSLFASSFSPASTQGGHHIRLRRFRQQVVPDTLPTVGATSIRIALASCVSLSACSPNLEGPVETVHFRSENGLSPDRITTEWRASRDGNAVLTTTVSPWGTRDAERFSGARFAITSDEFDQLMHVLQAARDASAKGYDSPCGLPDGGGETVHYVGSSAWKWSSSAGCQVQGASLDRRPEEGVLKASALMSLWANKRLTRISGAAR